MTADGVWRIEQASNDGWEPVGTAFLEDGRYLRGGVDAFTAGHYRIDGDRIIITATTTRLGGTGAVFGRTEGEVGISLEGSLRESEILAQATDGRYTAHYRYTRLGDMPD